MESHRKAGVFFAALIVAVGGVVYEMIIATAASYLLGDGVTHFSLTIGFFLFGMGIGSLLAPLVIKHPEESFAKVEILLGLLGGFSVTILFAAFAFTNLVYVIFTLLLLVVGTLIGLEIPLLISIIRYSSKEEHITITSRVLSFDYFGALIASIGFPLFLLPQLGLQRSSFLIGIINLLVALLMIVGFDKQIRYKGFYFLFCLVSMLILGVGFAGANEINSFINQGIYQDEVILSKQSKYQNIVFTMFKNDLRMYLNGNIQFSSKDEYRYHETLVHVPIMLRDIAPTRVLILGGGDGLALREVLKYQSIESVKIVDLDEEVTNLAMQFTPLVELNRSAFLDNRVTINHDDAFNYLNESEDVYDLVIVDLPDPNNESLAKLYSTEFYQLLDRRLSKDGFMITQAASPYFTPNTFWTIERTVSAAGFHTYPIHVNVPAFGEWGFVIGSKLDSRNVDKSLLAQIDDLKFVDNPETVRGLFNFDDDMRPNIEITPSTLIDPKVIYTYGQEESLWQ